MPYDLGKDATPSLAFGETGRAITPDDDNDIVPYPRSVYVGTAGNVRFLPARNADGAYLTLPFAVHRYGRPGPYDRGRNGLVRGVACRRYHG